VYLCRPVLQALGGIGFGNSDFGPAAIPNPTALINRSSLVAKHQVTYHGITIHYNSQSEGALGQPCGADSGFLSPEGWNPPCQGSQKAGGTSLELVNRPNRLAHFGSFRMPRR
jgi:hypothetical protein